MTETEPQTNGVMESAGEEDDRGKMRPADIDADVREMERRKRVEAMMNSRLFREELERIIELQMKDGNGPAGLLQQISDMMGIQAGRLHFKGSSCVAPINDIRGVESMGYAKGEKNLRCKLACVFRLMDLYGWSQGIHNMITVRLSQDEDHFLVNPYGMLYNEMTASSLAKVDMQGNIVEPGTTNFNINVQGYLLHSAIHANRPDLKCIIHVHTPSVLAVSSLKCGLLPLCEEACLIGEVSHHPYAHPSFEFEEREKLIRNLGPSNKVLLLNNQGAVCGGATVEEAFYNVYNTVLACETQVKLLPAGLDNLVLIEDEARKTIYDAAHRAPPTDNAEKRVKPVRVGELEFEALARMLDNAGFRTGYIYRHPLIKGDIPRPKNDVEVPPAVSSLGYLIEEEEMYRQGNWKKYVDGRNRFDRSKWLNSPNVYQKVEILETGTPDPKKITKWVDQSSEEWVAEASPTHSTPVKIDSALQFVPKGTNPKEFKKLQQQLKENRRADKITSGPQSHILEGVSWEEAKKLQDANITQTGDQVILVGAASKGIIQRNFQHNALVYKTPYAKNPFDCVSDKEIDDYKKLVERKQRGDTDYEESQSESEAMSSSRQDALRHIKSPLMSPQSATSETEEESRDEPRVLRIETKTAPRAIQAEVVLSDAESDTTDPRVERSQSARYPQAEKPESVTIMRTFRKSWSLKRDKDKNKDVNSPRPCPNPCSSCSANQQPTEKLIAHLREMPSAETPDRRKALEDVLLLRKKRNYRARLRFFGVSVQNTPNTPVLYATRVVLPPESPPTSDDQSRVEGKKENYVGPKVDTENEPSTVGSHQGANEKIAPKTPDLFANRVILPPESTHNNEDQSKVEEIRENNVKSNVDNECYTSTGESFHRSLSISSSVVDSFATENRRYSLDVGSPASSIITGMKETLAGLLSPSEDNEDDPIENKVNDVNHYRLSSQLDLARSFVKEVANNLTPRCEAEEDDLVCRELSPQVCEFYDANDGGSVWHSPKEENDTKSTNSNSVFLSSHCVVDDQSLEKRRNSRSECDIDDSAFIPNFDWHSGDIIDPTTRPSSPKHLAALSTSIPCCPDAPSDNRAQSINKNSEPSRFEDDLIQPVSQVSDPADSPTGLTTTRNAIPKQFADSLQCPNAPLESLSNNQRTELYSIEADLATSGTCPVSQCTSDPDDCPTDPTTTRPASPKLPANFLSQQTEICNLKAALVVSGVDILSCPGDFTADCTNTRHTHPNKDTFNDYPENLCGRSTVEMIQNDFHSAVVEKLKQIAMRSQDDAKQWTSASPLTDSPARISPCSISPIPKDVSPNLPVNFKKEALHFQSGLKNDDTFKVVVVTPTRKEIYINYSGRSSIFHSWNYSALNEDIGDTYIKADIVDDDLSGDSPTLVQSNGIVGVSRTPSPIISNTLPTIVEEQ